MKKGLFALIFLSLIITSCGTDKVIIKTKAQGNILNNMQLKYRNPDIKAPVTLKNGETVILDSDNYQTFYVDLSKTSNADHIRLIDEMNRGMKAWIVIQRASNKAEIARVTIPKKGIEGYTKKDTVTTVYDRRGKAVGTKKVVPGSKLAYGDKVYTNGDVIPVDINFTSVPEKELGVIGYIELDYSNYEQDASANTTEVDSDTLNESEGEVDVVHHINYREVYFDTVRKTPSAKFHVIKETGTNSIEESTEPVGDDDLNLDSLD